MSTRDFEQMTLEEKVEYVYKYGSAVHADYLCRDTDMECHKRANKSMRDRIVAEAGGKALRAFDQAFIDMYKKHMPE